MKKADLSLIREKIGALALFFQVLGVFFVLRGWGLVLATRGAMLNFKIQVFILIHFTNLAGRNAAKQRMTKYLICS